MSTVPERLAALRAAMKKAGADICVVPTSDFHGSENIGDYFKCREYITGFTGSAGTAVISADEADLWVDGRYFLQGEAQLKGSGIRLRRMGAEGVPTLAEYLKSKAGRDVTLAFDGRIVSASLGETAEKEFRGKGGRILWDRDLVGEIWEERPAFSCEPAYSIKEELCGESRISKLSRVREKIAALGGDRMLFTSLVEIAWILNIRGNDSAFCPVVLSFLSVSAKDAVLFIQEEAVSDALRAELSADGITLMPYMSFYEYTAALPGGEKILYDKTKTSCAVLRSLPKGTVPIGVHSPAALMKAIKNETEQANIRKAHIADGVAVTRFLYWVRHTVGKQPVTEISAAEKLEEFKRMDSRYLGPSFETISAYGPHAAITHYNPTPETDIPLEPRGFLLVDNGSQYPEGTTDITRTIALGETTRKEKEYFTRVLRGNLKLADARFLHGCTGQTLDILAREPLWEVGADYRHGTGHGVGYLLAVHERPNRISWSAPSGDAYPWVFEEGMLTSDEPGIYFENEFGIRHENLMLCRKDEKNEFGQFMRFETVTMVPFDLDAVLPEMMTEKERKLLNDYHRKVYETISPFLEGDEKEWLKEATRPI